MNKNTNDQAVYDFLQGIVPIRSNGSEIIFEAMVIYKDRSFGNIIYSTPSPIRILIDLQACYRIALLDAPECGLCYTEFSTQYQNMTLQGETLVITDNGVSNGKPRYEVYITQ